MHWYNQRLKDIQKGRKLSSDVSYQEQNEA